MVNHFILESLECVRDDGSQPPIYHTSRFQTNLLTSLTNCSLFLLPHNTFPLLLLCGLDINIPNKKASIVAKVTTTLIAYEAPIVPFSTERFDSELIEDDLLTASAACGGALGVASHAISVAIVFDEGST